MSSVIPLESGSSSQPSASSGNRTVLEHNDMGLIVHARIEWEHRLAVDGAWFSSGQ